MFVKVFRKKRRKDYLNEDLRRCNVPGEKLSFHNENKRIIRLRRWIDSRRRKNGEDYGRKRSGSNLFIRIGGPLFLVACLVLFVVAGGGKKIQTGFQSLEIFKVNEVVFSGCAIVSRETLQNVAGIILHQTSLIGLESDAIESRLAAVDSVANAKVIRSWPSTINITIKENVPIALLHTTGTEKGVELHYIDRRGKVFLPVRPGADIDFPVITGLSEIDNKIVKNRALSEALVFLRKLRVNNPHLPAQSVSEIHVDQNGEMVVYLVEYPFPIFFGNGDTKKKYARLVQVLKALYKKKRGKELISRVEYIQMDYLNDKVLVAQSGSG